MMDDRGLRLFKFNRLLSDFIEAADKGPITESQAKELARIFKNVRSDVSGLEFEGDWNKEVGQIFLRRFGLERAPGSKKVKLSLELLSELNPMFQAMDELIDAGSSPSKAAELVHEEYASSLEFGSP